MSRDTIPNLNEMPMSGSYPDLVPGDKLYQYAFEDDDLIEYVVIARVEGTEFVVVASTSDVTPGGMKPYVFVAFDDFHRTARDAVKVAVGEAAKKYESAVRCKLALDQGASVEGVREILAWKKAL